MSFFRSNTFASSTQKTYATQASFYFEFCAKVGIQPVPLSQADLGRYIAYLSHKLTYNSIRQYLNVLRILHLDAGYENSLANNWYVTTILKGVRRVKGDSVTQKLPITTDILKGIFKNLNLLSSFDRTFWAACLLAFFSFFCKCNLLIPSSEAFNSSIHLCATDVDFTVNGVVLTVHWSKVFHFKERTLQIPLPLIPGLLFFPSTALSSLCLDCLPPLISSVPLFRYKEGFKVMPLTQSSFTARLHCFLTQLGFPAGRYSGHSFRRGGAMFAMQCGLPVELIKLQGDWKSNACERYLEPSFRLRRQVAATMGEHISRQITYDCQDFQTNCQGFKY